MSERGAPGVFLGRAAGLGSVWAEGAPRVFLGRHAELESLGRAREAAHTGNSRTVLVDGPPGVGKSALLRRFLSDLEGVHFLDASGDELETATTYGVVQQLLWTAPFPSAQSPATLDPASLPDPPTVGAELFSLLGAAAGDAPVVLVVDDLHWADTASLQALAFALRRLRSEPVLALLAVRRQELHRLPPGLVDLADGRRGVRVSLAGLEPPELAELAWLLDHGRLSEVAVERLHRHTDGNPLHARALLEELSTEELESGSEHTVLPAPRAFAALVLDRLADCPRDAEALVAAAAVMGMSCPLPVASQLAEVDDPLSALEAAVQANLLMARRGQDGYEVRFPHVLVRAAVYHQHLGPARAASLHRRAAALVDDEAASLRHRAAASEPDAALADEAVAFARREAARGAWPAAAAALLQAARVSPTRDERERRLVDALEYLLLAGDGPGVRALTPRLEGVVDGARTRYIRGRLALVGGDWPGARKLLEDAWAACDADADPALAARIAGMVAGVLLNLARGAEAAQWARRALELGRGEVVASDAPWVLMFALALSRETEEGLALAETFLNDPDAGPAERVGALTGRGVLHLWRGAAEAAAADLAAAYKASQHAGPFHIGHIALLYLADAEYRQGAWDEALARADTVVSAAADAGQTWFAALAHAVAAFPLAARGEWEAATRHTRAAEQSAASIDHVAGRVWAATAAARLAHAREDYQRLLEAVEPVTTHVDELELDDLRNPAIQPWALLEAEARLRTGQRHGERELDSLYEEEHKHPNVLIDVNRVQGLTAAAEGDGDQAEEAFRTGLRHAEGTVAPFAHALLELEYGTFLRQEGRRSAARGQLEAAHGKLMRLGARPYLARCERELRACGGDTGRIRPGPRGPRSLTPQESAVAKLVGGGATNRETAAALFVSVKAVEYHLSNIYRKLEIRSRTELASRMADADPPPVHPSDPS